MALDPHVLEISKLSHWYGSKKVLFDVNFEIVRGEIVSLVGPSGCGKSTLLRAILGTHPPRTGKVVMHRTDGSVEEVRSPGRDRGIVYQRYSLFPNLTARENVAFGLMLDQTKPWERFPVNPKWRLLRKEHFKVAEHWLERMKLGHAMHSYPHELSGGMQQRVSIAQALVVKPEILLLDEPFGALDEATREELQRMLLELYAENLEAKKNGTPPPYTILIVTHELNEAIFVGDRILGLSQYWDWKASQSEAPGATIVLDQASPVFEVEDDRAYHTFKDQKINILNSTFSPDYLQARDEWHTLQHDIESGIAGGILAKDDD